MFSEICLNVWILPVLILELKIYQGCKNICPNYIYLIGDNVVYILLIDVDFPVER